jgi:hypothetical protein
VPVVQNMAPEEPPGRLSLPSALPKRVSAELVPGDPSFRTRCLEQGNPFCLPCSPKLKAFTSPVRAVGPSVRDPSGWAASLYLRRKALPETKQAFVGLSSSAEQPPLTGDHSALAGKIKDATRLNDRTHFPERFERVGDPVCGQGVVVEVEGGYVPGF